MPHRIDSGEALDTANSESNYQHYLAQFDNSIRPNRKSSSKQGLYRAGKSSYIVKGMEGISVLTGEQGQISYEVNIQEETSYFSIILPNRREERLHQRLSLLRSAAYAA